MTWALAALLTASGGLGCSRPVSDAPAASTVGGASATTATANALFAQQLNLADAQDFEDAKRGLIARPSGKISSADGTVLVDFDAFKFVDGAAPPTVNPSLWRHAVLSAQIGLFKVVDGVWQVRVSTSPT